MKTIKITKAGKNWNVSTQIDKRSDEFFSFTSKKRAEEFIKKYTELGYIAE